MLKNLLMVTFIIFNHTFIHQFFDLKLNIFVFKKLKHFSL